MVLLSPVNIRILAIFGHFGPGLAGSFGALLVVVAHELYLARHLFTLFFSPSVFVRFE